MKNIKRKVRILAAMAFMVLAAFLVSFVEGGYMFPQFYGDPDSGQQDISLKAYEESLISSALDAAEENNPHSVPAGAEITNKSKLMVGGTSLGIIMRSRGVMVVGYSAVGIDDKVIYPAKEAGIALGDSVLAINGIEVEDDDTLLNLINSEGTNGDLVLTITHGSRQEDVTVTPYFCEETNRYRIGLYVRDNMGGVGTLTFYDPVTQRFGALGHPIEGVSSVTEDDNVLGHALPSSIRSIKKAVKGETGEKIGYFEDGSFDGVIDSVGDYGIYGTMSGIVENPLNYYLYPAAADEVEEGRAEIVTVIEDDIPVTFEVEITKVDKNNSEGKGLSLKITDKELLNKTGGIIQGMSGSPIIQNNKLVGAVTYVTVNNPEKGYGCLIQYMIDECNNFK